MHLRDLLMVVLAFVLAVSIPAGTVGGAGEPAPTRGSGFEATTQPTMSVTASPSTAKIGEPIQFEATVSGLSDGVTIDSYEWNFGDDIDRAGASPTHTYVSWGTYTVSVTARTENGTTYSGATTVTVDPEFADVPPLDDGVTTRNGSVYEVNLSENQSLGLSAVGAKVRRSSVLLYGPEGQLIQRELAAEFGYFFGTTAERAGTFHVGIHPSARPGFTDPATTVEAVIRDPDGFEPNQARSSAPSFEPGTNATGLTLTEADGVDWYAVTVDGPTTINVSADVRTFARAQGDVQLALFDSAGTAIGEVTSDAPASESGEPYNRSYTSFGYTEPEQRATVETGGTYYVRVTAPGRSATEENVDGFTEYDLAVETTAGPGAPDDGPASDQGAYDGTPRRLPGTIDASHFDTGGEGVAYHDTTGERLDDNDFRPDVSVDIESPSRGGTGDGSIGYVDEGE